MLPVVGFLTGNIPGASGIVLYYALSMGAAMGGNGFLVGAEANLVTAGITAQAGSPISFGEFMKVSLLVTYLTLTVGFLWLLIRFTLYRGAGVATILHPTRGGQSSYPNQDKAIALARERNEGLVLLYVSNVRFLDTMASAVPIDLVKAELDELGEFMLAMAQERAEKAADMIVRQGMFNQALQEVIEEYEVGIVIWGSPADNTAVTTPSTYRSWFDSCWLRQV